MDFENTGQPKVTVTSGDARPSTLPRSLTDSYRKKMGENIELSDKQKSRLKKFLKKRLTDWQKDTEELHTRLQEDNDLVEGVIMETDFPFEGASNVHVPITETYMDVYWSIEKRSLLGSGIIWNAITDVDALRELTDNVAEALNYYAVNIWNIANCLKGVFWTTNRDGLGILQITWAEEYEKASDVILIANLDEFLAEFPSPEESGLSEEEWFDLAARSEEEATEELPMEIPVTFEKQVYYGCKGEIVELVNFVTIPATVSHISDSACRGYGKYFEERRGIIRQKAKDATYYKDAVDRLLKKERSSEIPEFTRSQDEIEGLSRSNTGDTYGQFELVIKGKIDGDDGDGEESKYLVVYNLESDELLRCIDYPYRVDYFALFHIDPRPNRLIGKNVPGKTRDMNDENDTQHNQRINARTIGTVPSFKAQKSKKEELDPALQANRWRPGVIFWLDNFEEFEQFKVQPTDMGESMAEEKNNMNMLDLYLGSPVSVMSGGVAPGDPSAPGNKHEAMIAQGNLRMDGPLGELRYGVEETGDICLSHAYQFGPPILEYQAETETAGGTMRETRTLHKRFLRRGIHMRANGVTVMDNPDKEMARGFQLYGMLMQEPTFAQNTSARIECLKDALRAGYVQGRNRYLLSPQEIEQQEVELRKKAMLQMLLEKKAAEAEAAAGAQDERIKAAKTEQNIENTARATAEANLGSVQ